MRRVTTGGAAYPPRWPSGNETVWMGQDQLGNGITRVHYVGNAGGRRRIFAHQTAFDRPARCFDAGHRLWPCITARQYPRPSTDRSSCPSNRSDALFPVDAFRASTVKDLNPPPRDFTTAMRQAVALAGPPKIVIGKIPRYAPADAAVETCADATSRGARRPRWAAAVLAGARRSRLHLSLRCDLLASATSNPNHF